MPMFIFDVDIIDFKRYIDTRHDIQLTFRCVILAFLTILILNFRN